MRIHTHIYIIIIKKIKLSPFPTSLPLILSPMCIYVM